MTTQRTLPLVIVLLVFVTLVFAPSVLAQEGLPTPVAVPSNTAGEISLAVPSLRYVVVGNGGESVVIQVLGLTPNFAPRFSVRAASGDVVLDVANPDAQPNISGDLLLSTGAYIIEVSADGGSGGQFVLALQAGIAPPDPVDLVLAEPVSATVGGDTPLLIYRFDAEGLAGQTLRILAEAPAVGPAYRIIDDATGNELLSSSGLFAGDTHVLGANGGVYRVEVRAAADAGDTPFSICLGCTEAAGPEATETPEIIADVPTATPTPEPTVVVCNIVSNIAGNANVRRGPGEGFGILGAFSAGQSAPALAQTGGGGWFMFSRDGVDAWVSGAVVRLEGDCAALPVVSGGAAPARNATTVPAGGNAQPNSAPVASATPASGQAAGQPPAQASAVPNAGAPPAAQNNGQAAGQPAAQPSAVPNTGAPAGNTGGQPSAVPNAVAPAGNTGSQGSSSTAPAPDLVVDGELFIDDTVLPNRMMWYGSAFNSGNAPTGPWQIRLCAGNTCEQFPMESLEPRSGDGQWLVYPVGQGVLTHTVIADSTNIVTESNENNNALSRSIGPESAASWAAETGVAPAQAQTQGQPDLVITSVELRIGTDTAYRINIANIGATPSSAATLQFCVYECLNINIPELAPNESKALRYPFVPQGGQISYSAVVDSNSVVAESNENNNSLTGADILTP